MHVFDASNGREILLLRPHASYIYSLAWSPDGETLVTGSGDSTVLLHGTRPTRTLLAPVDAGQAAIEARWAASFERAAASIEPLPP